MRQVRESRNSAPALPLPPPDELSLKALDAEINARRAFRSIDEWHAEQWEQLRAEDREASTATGIMDSIDE
jgi:hypothetical protein